MKKTLKKNASYGKETFHRRREIVITNYISMTLAGTLLSVFTYRQFAYQTVSGGFRIEFLLVGLLSFLLPLLLNVSSQTTISRILLCILPIGFLWYVYIVNLKSLSNVDFSTQAGFYIHLLAMSIIPYLIFGKRELPLLIIGILPCLVSILFMDQFMKMAGITVEFAGMVTSDYQLIPFRVLTAYLLISMGSFTFHSIIVRNDETNARIMSKLKDQAIRIEEQNKVLSDNQIKMTKLNKYLNEQICSKRLFIKQQSEKIESYAHANAHEIRGPIARMSGLLYLSRLDPDMNSENLLQKIENEIKDLELIVSTLSQKLHANERV